MPDALNRVMFIRLTNGQSFHLTIPNTAKITYGNLHPGSKSGYGPSIMEDRYVLRIYEGIGANQRQTAVFRGVEEFRDTAYQMTLVTPIENVEKNQFIPVTQFVAGWGNVESDEAPIETQWVNISAIELNETEITATELNVTEDNLGF